DLNGRTTHPTAQTSDTTGMLYDGDGELLCLAPAVLTAVGGHCPALNAPRAAGTSTWDYDAAGQVTTMTDPGGGVTSYVYDANGNRTGTVDPNGNEVTTAYDKLNRASTVTRGAGTAAASTTAFHYDIALGAGACSAAIAGATYCSTVVDPNGSST